MTNSVTGPRRSSKPLSKAKLAPKKGHGHWWSAACLIHYSFRNPAKTITSEKYAQQINEMHQLQCLELSLIKGGPNSSAWQYLTSGRTINTSKVKWIGLWSFASSAIFTWPLANWLPLPSSISTTFCRENASTTSRRQKKTPAFLEFVESWSMNFYATKINLLLIGKNVTIMVPILTNKDMFEPSNNDLKFTVRNLKYFCTNLTVIHVSMQLEIFVWYVNPKFTFLV